MSEENPNIETDAAANGSFSPRTGSAPLTEGDKAALALLPTDGWFPVWAVNYMVKNPRWRCDRLVERGALESRVVGNYPNLRTEYRLSNVERSNRQD